MRKGYHKSLSDIGELDKDLTGHSVQDIGKHSLSLKSCINGVMTPPSPAGFLLSGRWECIDRQQCSVSKFR